LPYDYKLIQSNKTMKPTDVQHARFPVDKVLYDDEEFSIVWGAWDGDCNGLGMRWNRKPAEPGFPLASGGRPVWLVIPLHLSAPFLTALIGKPHTNNAAVLEALRELEEGGALGASPK